MDKLIIKSNPGIEVSIELRGKITVITGDSASGKSYICNHISKLKAISLSRIQTNVPLQNIVIWSNSNDIDSTVKDKIVIIDRYDYIALENKEIEGIIHNSNNIFILMAHGILPESINVPATALLVLKHIGNKYYTKDYRYSDESLPSFKLKKITDLVGDTNGHSK